MTFHDTSGTSSVSSRRQRVNELIDAVLEFSIVGSFTKIGYLVRSRLDGWVDPSSAAQRTIVITGATSGLGLAAAQRLATLGANVHLVGRSQQKLDDAVTLVQKGVHGSVSAHRCDLSLLHETTALASELAAMGTKIDVLVHNAGALLAEFTPTHEGVETTLATHLLSPFQLTEQLISLDAFAPQARVIMMTSGGMYTERFNLADLEMAPTNYKGAVAYARAKRAQSVLQAHWQATYGSRGLAFHLVHPGWAKTPGVASGIPLFSKVMNRLLRSAPQGCDTLVWLAGEPDGEPAPGLFWLDRHPRSLYRLRSTRLSEEDERAAESALPVWCQERIAVALGEAN
jgi:NAD(P)-dependent dehydrogenase (short-subunit alcohol dehydrogenase family)